VDATARAAAVGPLPDPAGRVVVLCGDGADPAVAAEAAFVARVSGTAAVVLTDAPGRRLRDVAAGLATDPAAVGDAGCLVVVTGPDASLAAAVAGATSLPVVAVPTSAGRPGGYAGLGALMAALGSGLPVGDVDNGHAAGVFAARVARRG
jgi:NCAIR mutase (PurE)-related protein